MKKVITLSVMENGVIIIATGKPIYGRLAYVLAVSIRNKSQLPIALIHDDKSLKHLPDTRIFSHTIEVDRDESMTNNENAFKTKTMLYDLSLFDTTLFLDADNIICPGKSVDDWFEELGGVKFTTYCNGKYSFRAKKHDRADYPYWAEPEEVIKNFDISKDALFPQINTSFIFFRKDDEIKKLFDTAKMVWDHPFESGTYRGAKTDEFCFNTACAICETYPHIMPYKPLFFYFNSESVSEPYILDNFSAISVITDKPEQPIIDLYNRLMTYYFGKFGIKELFYYSDKMEKEKKKIIGFWHIAQMGKWKDVVEEQLNILLSDGLYESCSEVVVNVAGTEDISFDGYPKIKIQSRSHVDDYEFPALHNLKKRANSDDFYGFYFHTKGVSKSTEFKDNWRNLLNHYVLRNWENPYSKVSSFFDISGPNYHDRNQIPPHFSGNFFWFDSEYVKRLPEIRTLDQTDRYQAEMWIASSDPKVYGIVDHLAFDDQKEWFPQRKIGVFLIDADDIKTKATMLKNSGLLLEAHSSFVFSDKKFDGFTVQASKKMFEKTLKVYISKHPDAFICLCNSTEAIYEWKKCYRALEAGYEEVISGETLWISASKLAQVFNDPKIKLKTYKIWQ